MADTPIRDRIKATRPAPPPPARRIRRHAPAFATLLFACLMAAMVASSGVLGWRDGQQQLGIRRTATIGALIGERFDAGLRHLQKGNPVLAQANLEEVLRYQPGNAGARDLLATAIHRQTPTPTFTPRPTVTPAPTSAANKTELLNTARSAADTNNWDEVIRLTDLLTAIDPRYNDDTVADLRYTAFLGRGLNELSSSALADLEAGIFDLDQAAEIRALPNAAQAARDTAMRYQTAIQYIGADWDAALRLLRALPTDYRDVAAQLRSAYVMAGDSFAQAENWCEAKRRYEDAAKALGASALQQKLTDAANRCAASGGAAEVTGFTVLPASGIFGRISFRAIDAAGAFQTLVYDSARGGVFTQSLGFNGAGIYSPDGSRYVQSSLLNGTQQIVVYGGGQGTVVATGTEPQWGPGGLIAYQGCSSTGCGLHVVNPDQPSQARMLTSSTGDIGYRWSPTGDRLVFAANRSGAWEIFTVGVGGDVVQVTSMGSSSGAPSWSPNGAQIAFLSNRDGSFGLFTINADGSGLQKLLDFGGNSAEWQGSTAWSP